MKLVWIVNAKYLHDHVVELSFNDGKQCLLDFAKVLNLQRKIFAPLADKDIFKDFTLNGWTLTWLNGKIDVAPEFLYEVATTQQV